MEHRKLRRIASIIAGIALMGALLAPISAASASPTCTTTPRIDGSFIQPALVDGWSAPQLSAEFTTLTNACITSQVLQWTADTKNNTTVYPSGLSGYSQSTSTDVVGRLLTAADTAQVTEYLGLQTNDDWWTNYGKNKAWLNAEATKANALADDLYAKYGTHSSFTGWYLPFEVDNWNFKTVSVPGTPRLASYRPGLALPRRPSPPHARQHNCGLTAKRTFPASLRCRSANSSQTSKPSPRT
jgi:hypothetical protein